VQLGAAAARGAGGSSGQHRHHGRREAELGAAPATDRGRCWAAARGGVGVGGGAVCRAQLGEAPESRAAMAEERVAAVPGSRVGGQQWRRTRKFW
jgi:hypothetical protein